MAVSPKTNHIGLPLSDYKGRPSTLCKGCGHDVISNTIISAFYELGIEPHAVAKLSGIGCSSKTPAYFLRAWGFNSVHGRMPSVATGALLANRDPGDRRVGRRRHGVHWHRAVRPHGASQRALVYIVENNGVYGLTKGQFSATADRGSKSKNGVGQRPTADRTWPRWRCSSARPTSRAASPATRVNWCR